MRITAITACWNSALWLPYQYKWIYPLVDKWIIQEVNYTSTETGWAGETSPDGTAEIIRNLPDPDNKIEFYQLGYYPGGVLASRAELCSHVKDTDWLYICDVDEFCMNSFHSWLSKHLDWVTQDGATTISQGVRSFYFDFQHHTTERFTRLYKWYPGLNPWAGANYWNPRDIDFMPHMGIRRLHQQEIFHYSYVPPPGVRIKGAMSFDISRERYQSWYENTYMKYTGDNLEEIEAANGGGVHVFGGFPLEEYSGPHPEVLSDHILRWAQWREGKYVNPDGNEVELNGWWNLDKKERK